MVEQRVNYLEQTGAGLAKEIGGQNVTFGNVKSLPAIIVNVYFDIPSNQIHLAEICKKVADDGWRISFCDTKGQKMKFYNDVFVVDFCYEGKKKKGIIGITYNDLVSLLGLVGVGHWYNTGYYVFIYYEYFWPIYELTRWGNTLLLSVCFEGYYLLLATWFGGILEPYLKSSLRKGY